MNEYDFVKLNDKEFESLSVDLLSKIEGKRIERFKPGKDFGVDGRFFASDGSEVIIQCKHWARSGTTALIRNLKKQELQKVRKLNPSRYILVTSVELSRQNKKIIKKLFSPFVKSESDILGKEDLNDLLSLHKEIEQKHYKLWLASVNVLRILLNAAIIGRSAFKIDEIIDSTSKYVRTYNHEKALEKIESLRSIIITGEPGIGKTTLADHLCSYYILNKYEFCYIEESISEAESLYDKDKKQIFYFDDFLGRNYLLALDRHEDSHVINFMKRVGRDKSKRFILTSRSTILNQGKRLSDLFKIENIDRNEYELNIKALSNFDKAKILYNHIWFSKLDAVYIEELYKDKRYKEIIKHRNNNPRLISFITDAHKVSDIKPKDYWAYIENTLDNPADIWGHVFDNQLDEQSRILISLVVFNGKEITEEYLKESFLYVANKGNVNASQYGLSDFYKSVKLAVGALINRKITENRGAVSYDLFNPAVGDYLLRRYSEDQNKLYEVFESLNTNESLENIANLFKSGIIDKDVLRGMLTRLLIRCLNNESENKSTEYIVRLISLSLKHLDFNSKLKEMLREWLRSIDFTEVEPGIVAVLADLIVWSIRHEVLSSSDLEFKKFFESILNDALEHDDYVALSILFDELGKEYVVEYSAKYKSLVVEYWQDMIDHDIWNKGVLDEYLYDEEENAANESLYQHVSDILSEYKVEFEKADIEAICEHCDVWQHIESNRENCAREDEQYERARDAGYSLLSEDAAIDDLFQRT